HIELLNAAEKVAGGERYLGKNFSKIMTYEYVNLVRRMRKKETVRQITEREKEVLELLIEGLTSPEIAARLYISPRTVDTHRTNLLKKLNQKNTASLVRFAI